MIKANSFTETEYHPRELLSSQVLLEPESKIKCEFRLNNSITPLVWPLIQGCVPIWLVGVAKGARWMCYMTWKMQNVSIVITKRERV